MLNFSQQAKFVSQEQDKNLTEENLSKKVWSDPRREKKYMWSRPLESRSKIVVRSSQQGHHQRKKYLTKESAFGIC